MTVQVLVERKTIPIRFSKLLEYKLLSSTLPHTSLSHDIEYCALKGLELLEELEDVRDIKHTDQIKRLINETNNFLHIKDNEFTFWHLNISENLLDEVDLLMMMHGEDLKQLGMSKISIGSILVLLVVAGSYHPECKSHPRPHRILQKPA